jgi:16S rRNA (cytidine1402-2'-O)-methyltransferase
LKGELAGGGLLVCATPIGNLEDVTLRVLGALREADILACEDTRHTRVLLERHQIHARELVSFHEHNERARTAQLLERMRSGAVVALVSDAGTPLISDPGYELVRAALDAQLEVRVLPGPSSVTAALVASGHTAQSFCFAGFLPRKRAELERVLASSPQTLVALESPRRLAQTLLVLSELEPSRQVAVCRELTKLHEEVRRATAAQLAAHYREHTPRGEVVLVIAQAPAASREPADALAALRALVDAGARPRPAAGVLAKLTGVSANELYDGLLGES